MADSSALHISVNGATVALCICSGKPHTAKCRLHRWALRHVEQPRLNFVPEPPAQAIQVNPQFHGEGYVPYLLTVFFFILTLNLLGLIPYGATATGKGMATAGHRRR